MRFILRKNTTVNRLYLKGVGTKFAYYAAIFDYSLHLYINRCYLDCNPKSLVSNRIHGDARICCSSTI